MFFFFSFPSIGITRQKFNPAISINVQEQRILKDFNKKIADNGIKNQLSANQLLILWDTDESYKFCTQINPVLISHLAQSLSRIEDVPNNLYIDSLSSLSTDGDGEETVANLLALLKHYTKAPIILDNSLNMSYEKKEIESLLSALTGISNNSSFPSTEDEMTSAFTATMVDSYLNDLFKSKLIRILEAISTSNNITAITHNQFIENYFLWQQEKISMQEAINSTENVSKATFYRYIQDFESSVFYNEFMKIYSEALAQSPKKGKIPEPFRYIELYENLEKKYKKNETIAKKIMTEYSEITCELDPYRIYLSAQKKLTVMKKKGQYNKALAEFQASKKAKTI